MLDFDIIETPENVELQRRLAGIGSRMIAGLIDNLIISAMYLLLFLIFLFAGVNVVGDLAMADKAGAWVYAILILIVFSIYWGYYLLFEYCTNGKTPGKKYMKIRVVQKEGQGVSFNSIAIRNLLRIIDSIGVYTVAGISMFMTSRMQRLGDMAAGTVVISEAVTDYSAKYDKKNKVMADEAVSSTALDATGLDPEEYRFLRNYWLRRDELEVSARERILPQLMKPIMERQAVAVAGWSLAMLEEHLEKMMNEAMVAEMQSGNEDSGQEYS